jgi:hypothetical protein
MEKLSLKTSKAMKLSKSNSFKKSKSYEIISFTFPFINIRNQKTTPRLGDSPTQRVGESLREKRQHRNRLFAHEGCLFPSEICEKDQNMTILGYSYGLQSSLYTKNYRFTLKALIFCPKTIATFVLKPLYLSKVYL